ncbi:thioredoxin domain-containing protein [Mycolicibacter sp. MYC123]|uniref:Thioredoxin domain-containing protein n=1 Tax=[Mycobacterium] zoologicum TaxID=2872311 RepID=A0ABU5YH57_9MYCO|nr:thioredoxin domain-containing protein [Mycolicibacter sp. MYC123]MEB3049357.1 thioredoxin domain-containing protein [Mycolicibacter sp. MYC123]
MRSWLGTLATLVIVGGALAGPAAADPPGTALSPDHFGVLAGSASAPVQLEIFCDPQCPECAKFESASGDDLGRHLAAGDVAVTYRWMTFLDARRGNDVSARVGNALMAAADPATSAASYQGFVGELYRRGGAPSLQDIADTARDAGLAAPVVERIASGQPAVDPGSMNAYNRVQLLAANPEKPGTPTVYDATNHALVDTDDAGWLDRLTHGS